MQRYPAWQALYRSFYSMDFYRDVAANWKEVGFLYLFLMAGLSWAAVAISFQIAFSANLDKILLVLDQMPTISSNMTKFSIDKPCPYHIRDLSSGQPIVTFDTSGATKSLDGPGLLLTDHELISFTSEGALGRTSEPKVLLKASAGPFSISKKAARDWFFLIFNFGALLVFFFCWLAGVIFLFVQASLYALAGLIFQAILKVHLGFAQLMRIAALSITPPLILDTVLKALNPSFLPLDKSSWGFRLVWFCVSMVYLYLGIVANKGESATKSEVVDSGGEQSTVKPES
jgi:hypothetical protein